MINTSDVFTQKIREKHNLKKIAIKRSDVFEENETSDELRRQKQKDGRDFSYRSCHSKVIDFEHLQKNIHLSIKNHKAIRISIVTTKMYRCL